MNSLELPYNSGEIKTIDNWPWWITSLDAFQLKLPIFSVGKSLHKNLENGIASFVVMHQERKFLSHAGNLLAEAIAKNVDKKSKILLLTSETKGSSIEPYISLSLERIIGEKLHQRKIVFRKGKEKVYMGRPVVFANREVPAAAVSYCSITSVEPQILRLSPDDTQLLCKEVVKGTQFIYVDDFIGSGGTIVGLHRLFAQLSLKPPRLVAVIGSDGNLYEQAFLKEGLNIQLLPQPFPLRLPTFKRKVGKTWQII